ncbi:MAG: hypothetical protein DI552_00535 [Brevundimonas sp.]|nr:MAG: hypothetical protein DI552_00535 [Brevundimonas sp.]
MLRAAREEPERAAAAGQRVPSWAMAAREVWRTLQAALAAAAEPWAGAGAATPGREGLASGLACSAPAVTTDKVAFPT